MAKMAANKSDFNVNELLQVVCQLSGPLKDIFSMYYSPPMCAPKCAPKCMPKPVQANPLDALFGEGGLGAIMKEVTVGINNEKPMGKKPKEPTAKKENPFEALLGEGMLESLIKEVTVKLEEKPVVEKPDEKKEATNKPTPVVKEQCEQKEEPEPFEQKEEPAQKPDEKVEGGGNVVLKNIVEIMPHADLASDSEKSTD